MYQVAPSQASGNIDNEGLIGRERQDHAFDYRRASIFRRRQADLGLLLAALRAQHGMLKLTSPSSFPGCVIREGRKLRVKALPSLFLLWL